jgi:hypothetical protein
VSAAHLTRDQNRDAEEMAVPGSVESFQISDVGILSHAPIDPQVARLV